MIGPGESGKTLVTRLMLGLEQPQSGSITVFGEEPGSVAGLQRTGAMLASSDYPTHLEVQEIISLVREHYSEPASVDALVQKFGIHEWLDQKASSMDTGRQRWLAFFLSLLGDPELLVMDSPTAGMDIAWRFQLWKMLGEFTFGGCSALVASDVLHDIEVFTTRVLLLHKGEILADGSSDEIIRQHASKPRIVSPLADAGVHGGQPALELQQAVLDRELTIGERLEEIVIQLTGEVRP